MNYVLNTTEIGLWGFCSNELKFVEPREFFVSVGILLEFQGLSLPTLCCSFSLLLPSLSGSPQCLAPDVKPGLFSLLIW